MKEGRLCFRPIGLPFYNYIYLTHLLRELSIIRYDFLCNVIRLNKECHTL